MAARVTPNSHRGDVEKRVRSQEADPFSAVFSAAGGDGADSVNGHDGNDQLQGDNSDFPEFGGNDTINGGDGDDSCSAGYGDDLLRGGDGGVEHVIAVTAHRLSNPSFTPPTARATTSTGKTAGTAPRWT
jgi:hypothetical protein